MASELESLLVKLGLEADDYSKGLDKAGQDTDDFVKKSGGAWDGFSAGVGIAVTEMATSAVAAIGGFAMDSLNMASDLGETTSKVETLFGESATEIENWAQDADTSFGLTEAAALDAVGGLGNMFLQLGAGSEQAGDLSQSMVGMAADLASFHNAAGGTSEVLDTMSAAFRGEYDSVQRFIPTINAANVETKALAMTNKASAKELTAMEKALAVQAILMEDAGAATGDFARTSSGMANQQRIMAAQWENIQTQLGGLFIPLATQAVSVINSFMPAIDELVNSIIWWIENFNTLVFAYEDGSGHFAKLLEIFGMTEETAQAVGQVFYDLSEVFATFIQPITDLIAQFVSWQDVLVAVGLVVASAVIPALVGIVVAAAPIIATFAAIIAGVALLRNAWESDFLGIRTATENLGGWIADNWGPFIYDGLINPFNDWRADMEKNAPATMASLKGAFGGFIEGTKTAWKGFTDFLQSTWQAFTQFWPKDSEGVLAEQTQRFTAFVTWLPQAWQGMVDGVKGVWTTFTDWWNSDTNETGEAVRGFWSDHASEVEGIVGGQWENIKTLIGTALGIIGGLLLAAFQLITGDWQGAFETLGSTATMAWDNIKGIFQTNIDAVKTIFDIFGWADIGRNIVEGMAQGIRDGINWIEDAARDVAQAAVDAAKWALGISSPAKIPMKEVGAPFSEGVGLGAVNEMETTTGTIQSALTRMVDRLSAPPVSLSAAGSAGKAAITINIYASDSNTAQQARSGILDGLRQAGLA